MFLFDTNVLSEVLRPRPDLEVVRRLLTCDPSLRFASELTRFELRYGVALHPNAEMLWGRIEAELLPRCTWLPVDDATSLRAADMAALQKRAGRPAALADLLIAATASIRDFIVVTRNVRHFEGIAGLRVENWFVT